MTDHAVIVIAEPRVARLKPAHLLLLLRLIFGIGVVAAWAVAARSLGPDILAAPLPVLVRVATLAISGELFVHVAVTMSECFAGMALGGGLGVVLPFLAHLSPRIETMVAPFVRAATGIPKLALGPLLILWFGIGMQSKIVLVALMVFFMTYLATAAGIRLVPPNLVTTARVLGAGRIEVLREIVWTSALPYVFAALKAAFPWSVGAALVTEFVASGAGLGYYIHHSYNMADPVGAFAGVLVVGVIVSVLDALLNRIRARALAWRPVDDRAVLH